MSIEMKNLTINNTTFEIVDDKARNDIGEIKDDITSLETLLRTIQEKLNSGSSTVDTVTVNEINDMIVEYFENKTVAEVEA